MEYLSGLSTPMHFTKNPIIVSIVFKVTQLIAFILFTYMCKAVYISVKVLQLIWSAT